MKKNLFGIAFFALASCQPSVFNISTSAMESTIEINSKIFIDYEAEVQRNDIVGIKLPSELGTFFVFRMIGQPGDSLKINKGDVYLNQALQKYPETIQFAYIIMTERVLDDEFFIERGINEFISIEKGYVVFTTEQRANELKNLEFINSVTKNLKDPGDFEKDFFPDFQFANKDNLGIIYLPKAGETINSEQLSSYSTTILNHEGVDVDGLQEYTFKLSYCFVMGDNRHNALDSRYIGLIPMNNVIGTVKNLR